jgi:preprotein translocase subunit SecE
MSKIAQYLKDTKAEMKHVVWPTKKQALNYTIIVVVVSLLVAYFLGLFDFLFKLGLGRLLIG